MRQCAGPLMSWVLRPRNTSTHLLLFFIALATSARAFADTIEFLTGAKSQGKVLEIRKAKKEIVFEVQLSRRSHKRVYPYGKIHAVTMKGKRYVLNEMRKPGEPGSIAVPRSRVQVEKLIDELGRTPPDWFEATKLDYPSTLDLSWPLKPEGDWNNQENVGQYIWDVINPNPGRWKSGVKLLHQILPQHQNDRGLLVRDMKSLAAMYFRFFQDYARAAFWWRKAGVRQGDPDSVALAECYWRLGNRQMATALLNARRVRPSMIKLWSDMGDIKKALELTQLLAPAVVRQGVSAGDVFLYAGDACRAKGQHAQAIRYYEQVLSERDGLRGRVELNRKRAQANIDAIRLYELLDLKSVPDGKYNDNSIGFSGPIHVAVTVRQGKIESVEVTKHEERQFYSALTDAPRQIIEKQDVKGIDATTRATVTAEAIVNATAKALARASTSNEN